MKKLTILGLVFLSMTILLSCGDDKKSKKSKKDREISVKNLDKDIDNEEDAVEAMITITKAQIELVEKAIGPPLLMMDDEDLEDRLEDITDAMEDVYKVIMDEGYDLEDADNWDEYEDLEDELEDLGDEYYDLLEEAEYDDREESYEYEAETVEGSAASDEVYYEGYDNGAGDAVSDYDYDEWNDEFAESFMQECISGNYSLMYDYCECALEEISYEYTPNELENLDPDEALEFIVEDTDCLELIDYDEY